MRPPDQFASAPAEACPFVALDDDRDRRAGGPDPRHRCFAVPVPEPRALAHQQAYCLTPNFPTCPFFIGWAARAAAAPVKAPPGSAGYPQAAAADSGYSAVAAMAGGGYPAAQPPQRPELTPQRPELTPLQPDVGAMAWSGQAGWTPSMELPSGAPPAAQPPSAAPQPSVPAQPSPPPPPPAAPTPGSTGQSWQGSGWNDDGDIFAPPPGTPAPPASVSTSASLVPSPSPAPASPTRESAPPSVAANVSTPPSAPPSFAPVGASSSYGSSASTRGDADPYSPAVDQPARFGASSAAAYAAATPTPAPVRQQARRPAAAGPADGEWSQGRRSQAFPNLGSRIRFGGVSPLLIGAFVLAVAALALFLLPGFLSNHGGGGGGGGGHRETPTAIAEASVTEGPPATPAPPTPRSYTVKSGDSLTKIAQRNDVTIENLACYNNIRNINALQIGQVLLIPPPDYSCPSSTSPSKKP